MHTHVHVVHMVCIVHGTYTIHTMYIMQYKFKHSLCIITILYQVCITRCTHDIWNLNFTYMHTPLRDVH
jgi:hypothetical protein